MSNSERNSDRDATPYFEGVEIGAVSVKWVRRTSGGQTIPEVIPHGGDPTHTVRQFIDRFETNRFSGIVTTGQAAKNLLALPYRSETECLEKALAFHNIEPDILLSLGGETFSVYPMKNGRVKNIIATSKCAAGTGEFIVQQFQRMGLTLEQGLKAGETGKLVEMATRCSVHCKSDATHKLNKGECRPGDIAISLVHDLAKKMGEMVHTARWSTNLMVVSGGVALNPVFLKIFCRIFNRSEVKVLPESPYLEAFGASLYASELPEDTKTPPRRQWIKKEKTEFETLEPLKNSEPLLDYRVQNTNKSKITKNGIYILGVDAGSTTTKAVLLNISDESVGASCYLRTLGNPVTAVKHCLHALIEQVGDQSICLVQAGVTGSAREMVSVYLNNCPSFNEILAHARAAAKEVPEVDTVFEIGGQDAKFISFLKGVPVDYAMNEGCSAGTGSFLEESASVDMGVAVDKISQLAESSPYPIAFGERCAAFINTDLRNALQQGADREDVIAGLVYAIADNYMSRIVGPRQIGNNLLFMGGVALNRSVALAMVARSGRKVVVPPHPELMGSVGTALLVKDRLQEGTIAKTPFSLEDMLKGEIEIKKTFRCKTCENRCEIQNIAIRKNSFPFGGLCAKYEMLRQGKNRSGQGQDLVALRNKIMFETYGPKPLENPRGTIGLPLALTTFELFPFYAKVINELGYNVVLSRPSKEGNAKTAAAICYPCQAVHGAVYDLLNQNVDFIFLPRIIELEVPGNSLFSYTCPSTSTIADIIKAAFSDIEHKLISPHLSFSQEFKRATLNEIIKTGNMLGIGKSKAKKAGIKALAHYRSFKESYYVQAQKAHNLLGQDPAIIVAGRPYTTCNPEINLALPRKITSRGYHVIPADMLPRLDRVYHPRDVWHFTQQIANAVAYVNNYDNLYICLLSCFSCGPDANIYHFIRRNLAGRTFCYLEIDSHTAHAGFETRVGAFLDIIEERRRRYKG